MIFITAIAAILLSVTFLVRVNTVSIVTSPHLAVVVFTVSAGGRIITGNVRGEILRDTNYLSLLCRTPHVSQSSNG